MKADLYSINEQLSASYLMTIQNAVFSMIKRLHQKGLAPLKLSNKNKKGHPNVRVKQGPVQLIGQSNHSKTTGTGINQRFVANNEIKELRKINQEAQNRYDRLSYYEEKLDANNKDAIRSLTQLKITIEEMLTRKEISLEFYQNKKELMSTKLQEIVQNTKYVDKLTGYMIKEIAANPEEAKNLIEIMRSRKTGLD